MRSYVAAFVLACVVSVILTPLVRRIALARGAFDRPGGRHVHVRSVPRLGGIAISLACCAPLLALFFVDSGVAISMRELPNQTAGLLLGGLALCALGVVDDTRGLRPRHKLVVQTLVAIGAYLFGFRIESIQMPLLGPLSMGVFALPVTVFWIVGVTNAVNLIDGLDGLAAGVVFFAAITNFVVGNIAHSVFVALLMAAVMGSLVGFLFYNFNPARIFMGDSGSYFLGYVLAVSSLAGASQKASTTVSLLVPIVALGLPIFDTLFAMFRRMLERRPLFSPDRGHIHHRLLDMGITHRRAVMILYGVCVVLTVAAIGVSLGRSWEVGLALLAATVVMVGLVRFVGYSEYLNLRWRQKAHLYDVHTERLRRLMPELPTRLMCAEDEQAVWRELGRLVREAELSYVEVILKSGVEERVVFREPAEVSDSTIRELVCAEYPLGRQDAPAKLRFGWLSETGDVSAQIDILLQIVADLVGRVLSSLRSQLVAQAGLKQEPEVVEIRALGGT
jgi:UDP-GlcNAc:undecaprenyl-phosphate GlcNAc-1-phosphate transferase